VLAEGVVIVVSVLVGLAIDSWWDDRQQTAEAHRELEGVLAELSEARNEIERGLGQHQRFLRASTELRSRLLTADLDQVVSVPDTLLMGTIFHVWVTDPPTALLDAFVSSGHLARLENVDLRYEVLAWRPLLEDLRGDELRVRSFNDGELTPYVRSVADVTRTWETVSAVARIRPTASLGRYPGGLQTPPDAPTEGVTDVPATLQFRNLLTQSVDWLGLLRAQSTGALEQLDLLAQAVRAELD
jgi:hypothetical protein